MATTETIKEITQKIYERIIKDEKVKCTCDELILEKEYIQAQGHYHTCELYQITRAIRIAYEEGYKIGHNDGELYMSDYPEEETDLERKARWERQEILDD